MASEYLLLRLLFLLQLQQKTKAGSTLTSFLTSSSPSPTVQTKNAGVVGRRLHATQGRTKEAAVSSVHHRDEADHPRTGSALDPPAESQTGTGLTGTTQKSTKGITAPAGAVHSLLDIQASTAEPPDALIMSKRSQAGTVNTGIPLIRIDNTVMTRPSTGTTTAAQEAQELAAQVTNQLPNHLIMPS